MRSALFAASALLLCAATQVRAAPCPDKPRDWSAKSLEALGEGGAIWKLADPDISVDALATALSTAYATFYHNPANVQEPPFLERFHDPQNWHAANAPVDQATFDFRAKDAYLADDVMAGTDIPGKLKAGWTWGPNPAHSAYDLFKFETDANRKSAKCKSDGLVMIGYYKWIDNLAGDARTPEAINEKRRNAQYIISIMDLKKEHLGWLKAMRTRALSFLKTKYDVDPERDGDTVRMYFHWPTGFPTSTLHMHARVNWRMSPVEYIHSYTLDDIIDALEHDKTVAQMVAERYKRVGGVVIDGNFTVMTSDDPEAAPSGTMLNRYLRSVTSSGKRVFGDARELPRDAFNGVRAIVRTAVVEGNGGGRRIYLQRPVANEKATNAIRADRLVPDAPWLADDQAQTVFTPQELTTLRLRGYRGTVTSLLACLVPFFDNQHVEDCVKLNADGSDIERYESYEAFRASMQCPAASTCYAARVEYSSKVNGMFRLWISDADWDVLKGIDARKAKMTGLVDGIDAPEQAFTLKDIGGKNIVTANPTREVDPMKLEQGYRQDEKTIAKWVGHWAMIVKPN